MKIDIYTDGACSGNPGRGGCAWKLIIQDGSGDSKGCCGSRGFRFTTNNRMEIDAVIFALYNLYTILKGCKDTDVKVTVYSDSQLVVNTMNQGWDKKTNKDLWCSLDNTLDDLNNLASKLNIKLSLDFVKVKAHADNQHNNDVDIAAVRASQQFIAALHVDNIYEQICKYDKESEKPADTVITDVHLFGFNKPSSRSIKINFSDGNTINIQPNNGGIKTSGTKDKLTINEANDVLTLQLRLSGWLHGEKL